VPTAETNGVKLHYELTGDGDLVFLLFNGSGLRLSMWGEVADRLADLGRVVRFDQRGVGGTLSEGPYSLVDVADDALGLLDRLGVTRVIVVGHAWGGRVAQVFVRDHPNRVRALVLCGTGGVLPPSFDPEAYKRLRAASLTGDRAGFEQAVVDMYCAADFATRTPERAKAVFDGMWESRFDGRGAREASAATPGDVYSGMATCPVQLIYGTEDKFGTPDNARDLQRRLVDSRLVFVEHAGHFVICEQPERVSAAIAAFVTELEGSRVQERRPGA
jgi:3-oxoadipate enol-lactonase